jgi:hypothetical protein
MALGSCEHGEAVVYRIVRENNYVYDAQEQIFTG